MLRHGQNCFQEQTYQISGRNWHDGKGKEQSLKINNNNLRCRFMSQRGMDKLKVLSRTTMVQVSWQITCTICCQSSQVMAPIRKWKILGQNHIIDCLHGKRKKQKDVRHPNSKHLMISGLSPRDTNVTLWQYYFSKKEL